jgi:hypothetical protein
MLETAYLRSSALIGRFGLNATQTNPGVIAALPQSAKISEDQRFKIGVPSKGLPEVRREKEQKSSAFFCEPSFGVRGSESQASLFAQSRRNVGAPFKRNVGAHSGQTANRPLHPKHRYKASEYLTFSRLFYTFLRVMADR